MKDAKADLKPKNSEIGFDPRFQDKEEEYYEKKVNCRIYFFKPPEFWISLSNMSQSFIFRLYRFVWEHPSFVY